MYIRETINFPAIIITNSLLLRWGDSIILDCLLAFFYSKAGVYNVYIYLQVQNQNPKKDVPVTEKEGHINPRKEIRLLVELQNLRFLAGK